jgi:hypothetical protein
MANMKQPQGCNIFLRKAKVKSSIQIKFQASASCMLLAGYFFSIQPKLTTNMKTTLHKRLSLVIAITFTFCFFTNDSWSQCKYYVVSQKGDTTVFNIPCNFPAKANTGDAALDQTNFVTAFLDWNRAVPELQSNFLPIPGFSGIKTVYFEITSADFSQFSEDRKNALAAYPALYIIIPDSK